MVGIVGRAVGTIIPTPAVVTTIQILTIRTMITMTTRGTTMVAPLLSGLGLANAEHVATARARSAANATAIGVTAANGIAGACVSAAAGKASLSL